VLSAGPPLTSQDGTSRYTLASTTGLWSTTTPPRAFPNWKLRPPTSPVQPLTLHTIATPQSILLEGAFPPTTALGHGRNSSPRTVKWSYSTPSLIRSFFAGTKFSALQPPSYGITPLPRSPVKCVTAQRQGTSPRPSRFYPFSLFELSHHCQIPFFFSCNHLLGWLGPVYISVRQPLCRPTKNFPW